MAALSVTVVVGAGITGVTGKASFQVINLLVAVKMAGTRRPAVTGALGVLLPAALPVRVSLLPFGTSVGLIAGSKERIPGTAAIDPVAVSRASGQQTGPITPSIGLSTPAGADTVPAVVGAIIAGVSLVSATRVSRCVVGRYDR